MSQTIFSTKKLIRFQHCDPAGIVFYPQFFVLLHEAQEDFFAHIGHAEPDMIRSGFGIPMVKMNTDFKAVCRNGDNVMIEMRLTHVGRSSFATEYTLRGIDADGTLSEPRLVANSVNVYMRLADTQAVALPEAMRAALERYLIKSRA